MFKPRARQAEVLAYRGGKMGVAAVPGSGKTTTLAALAAQIVAGDALKDGQEVLIVTLVNSAVDHFAQQVGLFMQAHDLLPNTGYQVCTLHSLCNDIVRERPSLLGLDEGFEIVDEREADEILDGAARQWLATHPELSGQYVRDDLSGTRRETILSEQWPEQVKGIARVFIQQAKDLRLLPDDLRARLDETARPLALAEMAIEIYADYQRGLSFRGAVDFQDLIRLALSAMELDPGFLRRLRRRWPYILEDEAQDSSKLQEDILRLLAGEGGNWVRVGDPNQAIYETFTTARPEHLWDFLNEPEVARRELPNSGRSAQPIIDLANALIDWTREDHPSEAIRARQPLQPPYILTAPPDDPQANPPAESARISFIDRAMTPEDEIRAVVQSLASWLPQHPDETVAVLVPNNAHGFRLIDAIKKSGQPLEVVELLRSTTSTRETAGAVTHVLSYLGQPDDARLLGTVYAVWRRDDRDDPILAAQLDEAAAAIRSCPRVEDYIWPQFGSDWLDDPSLGDAYARQPELRGRLVQFRQLVRRWQDAVLLPIDQLVLVLAQDLFYTPVDLAVAYSMASVLRRYDDAHPEWGMPHFTQALAEIARNERRFLGLGADDRGFDPQAYRGKVTVTTMHKAKGLEWDRVYLLSVNSYDFPSGQPGDNYLSEKWYIRDFLNLEAETLAQLRLLASGRASDYVEGGATGAARIDYIAERLRLLYVGITRARTELIVTWNSGRRGNQQAALPFLALAAIEAARSGSR